METEIVSNILAHFGTKGMRWGVRKESGSSGGGVTRANVIKPKPSWAKDTTPRWAAKSKVPAVLKDKALLNAKLTQFKKDALKTTKETSVDSATVKSIQKKAKDKGKDSLSNDEMRKLTQRFDLEQKYSTMIAAQHKKKHNPVSKFVGKLLVTHGSRYVNDIASAVVSAQVAKTLDKPPPSLAKLLPKVAAKT